MGRVPWWTVASAACAPILLIGGWTLAAALQPAGYSATGDTISALAGHAAAHREVMTAGLAGLGLCHVVTALGLRPAAGAGRFLLAVGGLATALVAALPLPRLGSSAAHGVAAGVGLLTLALWPALAWRRERPSPWALRPTAALAAAAVLLGLVAWFALELFGDGHRIGLAERVAAGAEALWPLVVVLSARAVDLSPRVL